MLFKKMSILGIEKIYRIITSLSVGVLLIRYLGPNGYGELAFVQTIVGLLVVFCTMGMDNIFIKDLISNGDNGKVVTLIKFRVILVISIIIILNLSFYLYYKKLNVIMLIYSFMLFQSINTLFDDVCQSKGKPEVFSYISMLSITISSCLKIACIYFGKDIFFISSVFVIEMIVSIILFSYYFRNGFENNEDGFDYVYVRKLLKRSFPFVLSGMMFILYSKIDQLMIANYLGAKDLGIYSASLRVSEPLSTIAMVLCITIYPKIISLYNNRIEYICVINKYSQLLVIISYVGVGLYYLFGANIFILLFGDEYLLSAEVLYIQILTLIFTFQVHLINRCLIIEELTKFDLIRTVVSLISNVILNIILIPNYGVKGAAIATLITAVISSWAWLLINKKTHDYFIVITRSIFLLNLKEIFDVKKIKANG